MEDKTTIEYIIVKAKRNVHTDEFFFKESKYYKFRVLTNKFGKLFMLKYKNKTDTFSATDFNSVFKQREFSKNKYKIWTG